MKTKATHLLQSAAPPMFRLKVTRFGSPLNVPLLALCLAISTLAVPAVAVPDGAAPDVTAGMTARSANGLSTSASQPTLVLQSGHGLAESVQALAFAPDGATFASSSIDSSIKIWEPATGVVKATLRGHQDQIYGLAYSPDGSLIASGSTDGTIKLWSNQGDLVRTFSNPPGEEISPWFSVAFAPDGKTLASASINQNIWLWEVATGMRVKTLAVKNDRVTQVAFSSDGRLLAGAGGQGIHLWDAHTREFQRSLTQQNKGLGSLAFSPDSQLLVSASKGRELRVWELATGRLKYPPLDLEGNLRFVAMSSDGLDIVGV